MKKSMTGAEVGTAAGITAGIAGCQQNVKNRTFRISAKCPAIFIS